MIKAKIQEILNQTFAPEFLEVVDESHKHVGHAGAKEGGHYQVNIISKSFQGKSPLEAHRMIYKALEPVKSSIHALAIKAKSN